MIGSPEYSSTPADQFVKHKFTKRRHSIECILINSNYDVAATASSHTPSKFIDTLQHKTAYKIGAQIQCINHKSITLKSSYVNMLHHKIKCDWPFITSLCSQLKSHFLQNSAISIRKDFMNNRSPPLISNFAQYPGQVLDQIRSSPGQYQIKYGICDIQKISDMHKSTSKSELSSQNECIKSQSQCKLMTIIKMLMNQCILIFHQFRKMVVNSPVFQSKCCKD